MPGPYIHVSTAKATAAGLTNDLYKPAASPRINPDWVGMDLQQAGRLMSQYPNYLSIGAIGPDLFFFLPDFRDQTILGKRVSIASVLVKVLDFVEEIYHQLDPIISAKEQYLGPDTENQAESISRLTGGLSEAVSDVNGAISGILIAVMEDLLVEQKDWWSFFSLGLNRGYDEQAFMWSDMLHYRQTESFARMLLSKAQEDTQRVYALGYMTHVATDVTGHALVNTICGGPFRLHWQRHHLVENHMDAYWYARDLLSPPKAFYPEFSACALYFDVAFAKGANLPVPRPAVPVTGRTLRELWARKRMLDIDSELPANIAQLIVDAMEAVYYDTPGAGLTPRLLPTVDGRPTTALVQEAYRLLFRYLKIASADALSHQPPNPPDLFPNLDFPTFKDPGPAPGPGDGNFWTDLLDIVLAVLAAILYVVDVAVYLAELPWAVVTDVATEGIRLGLYYALHLPLYHILKSFRYTLVMTGYLSPLDDEICLPLVHVGNKAADNYKAALADINDLLGGTNAPVSNGPPSAPEEQTPYLDGDYPHLHYANGEHDPCQPDTTGEYQHPWKYPETAPELAKTIAGPHGKGAGPDVLFRATATAGEVRDALETAQNELAVRQACQMLSPQQHLGDVVNFSKYVIWLATRDAQQGGAVVPMTEWNLDSDRGYGYHCWDWNRKPLVSP